MGRRLAYRRSLLGQLAERGGVQLSPQRPGQVVVKGPAEKRMGESGPARLDGRDEPVTAQGIEGLVSFCVAEAGHRGGHGWPELYARDCRSSRTRGQHRQGP